MPVIGLWVLLVYMTKESWRIIHIWKYIDENIFVYKRSCLFSLIELQSEPSMSNFTNRVHFYHKSL